MLLSSLLHDIAKKEGITDRKHADNSSFDSSFIIKKFNLPQEDEIKLYTLIKNHEWLKEYSVSPFVIQPTLPVFIPNPKFVLAVLELVAYLGILLLGKRLILFDKVSKFTPKICISVFGW